MANALDFVVEFPTCVILMDILDMTCHDFLRRVNPSCDLRKNAFKSE